MIGMCIYKSSMWFKCMKMSFLILIIIINISSCQQETSSIINPEVSSLVLQVTATETESLDSRTDVNVKRTVAGDGNKLKFKYDISTPSVDDFYFVLGLDSSGSLGFAGESDQAEAVIDAVPRFINYTITEYPNKTFNMSIVGWDNDIDFIYPEEIKLSPIQAVRTGINSVFGGVNDSRYLYRCEESDYTDLTQAIRTSIDILDNNPPIDYHRTMKFILIVVGAGEYTRCDPAMITEARSKNYNIYVVGMGFDTIGGRPTGMQNHLECLCGDGSRFRTCPVAYGPDLSEELFKCLKIALNTAVSEPVADNVTIVESFYGYVDPDETASFKIVGVPSTIGSINCVNKITNDTDRTNTIMFQLPELSQDNVTEVIFEANFSLSELPIYVTEDSKPIVFGTSAENTPRSVFKYRWLKNDTFNFDIPLQGNSIKIESAPSNVNPKKSEPQKDNPSDVAKEEHLGNGFCLMTLIILGITAMILRQNI